MKNRLFLLILGFILTLPTFAQEPVKAHFDECLDLMSVVWRLTGANEYNLCMAEQYSKEVDATFGEFRDHPVVQLAQKYRSQSGISYDAVAAYGLHRPSTKATKSYFATSTKRAAMTPSTAGRRHKSKPS